MKQLQVEYYVYETLLVARRVLKNAFLIQRVSPFRLPTKKELDKHSKLIEKQRRDPRATT